MMTLELEKYIKESLEQGIPELNIKSSLRSAGWQEADIMEGFNKLSPTPSQLLPREGIKVLKVNEVQKIIQKPKLENHIKLACISLIIISLISFMFFGYFAGSQQQFCVSGQKTLQEVSQLFPEAQKGFDMTDIGYCSNVSVFLSFLISILLSFATIILPLIGLILSKRKLKTGGKLIFFGSLVILAAIFYYGGSILYLSLALGGIEPFYLTAAIVGLSILSLIFLLRTGVRFMRGKGPKGSIPVIFMIIITITLGIGSGSYAYFSQISQAKNKPSPWLKAPIATEQNLPSDYFDVSTWKDFDSNLVNLKYPRDWTMGGNTGTYDINYLFESPDVFTRFSLATKINTGQGVWSEEYFYNNAKSSVQIGTISNEREIKINNLVGKAFDVDSGSTKLSWFFVITDNYFYTFSFSTKVANNVPGKIISEILGSIKIKTDVPVFTQQQVNSQTPYRGPLQGFLFVVKNEHYLVVDPLREVFNEQEIKSRTGLNDVYPPIADLTKPNYLHRSIISSGIAKEVAMANQLKDNLVGTQLKEPVLAYKDKGAPVFWEVAAVKDNQVIKYYDIDAYDGIFVPSYRGTKSFSNSVTGAWLSEDEARNILVSYLSKNGVNANNISEVRYIYYGAN